MVSGARSLAFVRSRRGAEAVALGAKRALAEVDPSLPGRVAAYRAGYLPEERRELERALDSGDLLGVAATNALELGVDISGLDAVILTGYPGTMASVWQQAGRAGRAGQRALAVLVARDDPLDTYLAHHPEALFGRPVEATVLDPVNPYVLGPHLLCAAAELPLTEADLPLFADEGFRAAPDPAGPPEADVSVARSLLADHVRTGRLRKRPAGWYWTSRDRPDVDLRGTGGAPVRLVEAATGRLLGTVDRDAAHSTVHTGAVYLHQGESYLVTALDLEESVAFVEPDEPDYSTSARDVTDIEVVETLRRVALDGVTLHYGTVQVTHQVVSFLRKRLGSGEVLGEVPLDLPPRELTTSAVWYTVDDALLAAAGLAEADLPGAAHAAEHAAIGLLPLVATCDRWDIGGVSTARHPDTDRLTVFVYDGHPGGAGFSRRGLRGGGRLAAGDPGRGRGVRVRDRVPVVRAVAEVRQRQRAAGQGGRGAAAGPGPGLGTGLAALSGPGLLVQDRALDDGGPLPPARQLLRPGRAVVPQRGHRVGRADQQDQRPAPGQHPEHHDGEREDQPPAGAARDHALSPGRERRARPAGARRP